MARCRRPAVGGARTARAGEKRRNAGRQPARLARKLRACAGEYQAAGPCTPSTMKKRLPHRAQHSTAQARHGSNQITRPSVFSSHTLCGRAGPLRFQALVFGRTPRRRVLLSAGLGSPRSARAASRRPVLFRAMHAPRARRRRAQTPTACAAPRAGRVSGLQNLGAESVFRPRKRMSSYFLSKRGVQMPTFSTRTKHPVLTPID